MSVSLVLQLMAPEQRSVTKDSIFGSFSCKATPCCKAHTEQTARKVIHSVYFS